MPLRAGANPILVRYDQAGRGYFVVKRDGADPKPSQRTPLAMAWFDDMQELRDAAPTPEFARLRADVENFIARERSPFVLTTEHVIMP